MTDTVLAIFGPTASGKTAIAQAVAERIPAELVSADSMQVYRGLPILTNQSPARLVGIWHLDHAASVAEYQRLAHAAIDEILESGRTPIVVGGTGLYLRAALSDLSLPPAPEPGERERLEQLYDEEGAESAHRRLAELDPEAAAAVHPNDRRRVVRSLELAGGRASATASGPTTRAIRRSSSGSTSRKGSSTGGSPSGRERCSKQGSARRRSALSPARSRRRRPTHTASSDIAEHPDDDDAIEALTARTRRYAAYQRKWMRRIPGLVSLPADRPPGEVADAILEVARARQRLPAGRAG